jgi:hypothetical protein
MAEIDETTPALETHKWSVRVGHFSPLDHIEGTYLTYIDSYWHLHQAPGEHTIGEWSSPCRG